MTNFWQFMEGKKTYIVATVAAGLTFAWQLGWIDHNTYEAWLNWTLAGGLLTLYDKLRRIGEGKK